MPWMLGYPAVHDSVRLMVRNAGASYHEAYGKNCGRWSLRSGPQPLPQLSLGRRARCRPASARRRLSCSGTHAWEEFSQRMMWAARKRGT